MAASLEVTWSVVTTACVLESEPRMRFTLHLKQVLRMAKLSKLQVAQTHATLSDFNIAVFVLRRALLHLKHLMQRAKLVQQQLGHIHSLACTRLVLCWL